MDSEEDWCRLECLAGGYQGRQGGLLCGGKITRAVSKLNNEFNCDPSGRVVTTKDLRALLHERHDCYRRVCAIADVPNCQGFSRRDYKILMNREQYANHIQVSRDVLNANVSFMNPDIELLCCCFVVGAPRRCIVDQQRHPSLFRNVYVVW